MDDLKIMGRIFVLLLFAVVTYLFSGFFVILFWGIIFILIAVGWSEAKTIENNRLADNLEKLARLREEGKDIAKKYDEMKEKTGRTDSDLYKEQQEMIKKQFPSAFDGEGEIEVEKEK